MMMITPKHPRARRWRVFIVSLLLLQLFMRTHNIEALPGYADESHHLRRAEVAWELTTDNYASYTPGKLLLYYYLAFFEAERDVFLPLSRLAVALITLLGNAALFAIGKQLYDERIGIAAMVLYATMPFTVFFDRMALADPLALTMLLLAICGMLYWLVHPTRRIAIFCGMLLILPPLAKLTAMGVVLAPVLGVLTLSRYPWRRYLPSGAIMLGIFGTFWLLMFAPVIVGEIQGGEDRVVVVGDYLLNINEQDQGFIANFLDNTWQAVQQTRIFYWTPALLLTGLLGIGLLGRRRPLAIFLIGMLIVAWLPSLAVGSLPRTRYLEIGAPLLILIWVCGAYALADAIPEVERRLTIERAIFGGFLLYGLAWGVFFFQYAATDPTQLTLPDADRWRYMQAVTAGYGQQDAVTYLETSAMPNADTGRVQAYGVLGSCHLMRVFMQADNALDLTCAPLESGRQLSPDTVDDISSYVTDHETIYIVLERDLESNFDDLPLAWQFVSAFPRPHDGVTIELWRVSITDNSDGLPPNPTTTN